MNRLITAQSEMEVISDAERKILLSSLEKASAEIASGDIDVLTRHSLRSEFEAIHFDGKSDTEIDGAANGARNWN